MKLQFLMPDGKRQTPYGDEIYIGPIGGFLTCPLEGARKRLLAGKGSVEHTISAATAEGKWGMEKHQELKDFLTKEVDCGIEVLVLSTYKDIPFRGFLDLLVSPDTFEEWIFKRSVIKDNYKPNLQYPNLLAYFYCKMKHLSRVQYSYKVWGVDTLVVGPPSRVYPIEYTAKNFATSEKDLNRIIEYYTGEKVCDPTYPSDPYCSHCRWKFNCYGR